LLVSLLPGVVGMSGWIYSLGAGLLGARFIYWAIVLWRCDSPQVAMRTFRFSIVYLLMLFILLLVDHYI